MLNSLVKTSDPTLGFRNKSRNGRSKSIINAKNFYAVLKEESEPGTPFDTS